MLRVNTQGTNLLIKKSAYFYLKCRLMNKNKRKDNNKAWKGILKQDTSTFHCLYQGQNCLESRDESERQAKRDEGEKEREAGIAYESDSHSFRPPLQS